MQGIRETIAVSLKLVFLVLFFFSLSIAVHPVVAQQNLYDTDQLLPSFHKQRREALIALLPSNSCAVIFANPVRNRSNDTDFQYSQDPDFYYLTGLNEPHSVLMLFSRPVKIAGRETQEAIFVRDRDVTNESWNGIRLGIEGVVTRLGFKAVFLNTELTVFIPDLNSFDRVLAVMPVDIKETEKVSGNLNSMVAVFKSKLKVSGKEFESVPLLKSLTVLREIKQPEELLLMQKAIDITVSGFQEAIRAVRPGMNEYQAQAIVEYYFKHNGSEYPGYGSIAGSGANSCVLHYVTNRKKLSGNDMLLMDMGAEYHGYTADVTRTIPVDGSFSPEEKAIYELVLDAQLIGISMARVGYAFHDPHYAATEVIGKGLVALGLIKDPAEVKKYFTHGTSHYLGLEVHDPGNYGKLVPGMVITVEPGIYIPEGSDCDKKWWNIGVRIEDDVLITDNEPLVMSGKLVKTVAELEKLMLEESLFNTVK